MKISKYVKIIEMNKNYYLYNTFNTALVMLPNRCLNKDELIENNITRENMSTL